MKRPDISRRTFVGTAAFAAASLGVTSTLTGCSSVEEVPADAKEVLNTCAVDCPHRCPLNYYVKDDTIYYVTAEGSKVEGINLRACPRGRASAWLLNSSSRLTKPLKRVGERGNGEWEEITWEEALSTVADKLKSIYESDGAGSVYLQDNAGDRTPTRYVWRRLLNTLGGYLETTTSANAQSDFAVQAMFGAPVSEVASSLEQMKDSDLIVLFGMNPADASPSGAGAMAALNRARQGLAPRTILIDPRFSNTGTHAEEWIPIRPGTDGALVAALAHTMFAENLVDREFLDTYTEGIKDYEDYVMGRTDAPATTPEWAAKITGIPAARIAQLAREIATAEAPFIIQGAGLSRRFNGEQTVRAIATLPFLVGAVGKPGTNPGVGELYSEETLIKPIPAGENRVRAGVPAAGWTKALEADSLPDGLLEPITAVVSYRSDRLVGEQNDNSYVADLLKKEEVISFFLAIDTHMTPTASLADIVLPELYPAERSNLDSSDILDTVQMIVAGTSVASGPEESRDSYTVCSQIADLCGTGDAFTEGLSLEDWQERLYDEAVKEHANLRLPNSLAQLNDQGVWVARKDATVGLSGFISNPETNALNTPSGRVQIAVPDIEKAGGSLIPSYEGEKEGFATRGATTFALQLVTWNAVNHAGSDFADVTKFQSLYEQRVWVNPLTLRGTGLKDNDRVEVVSRRGNLFGNLKVTPRVMPGVVALPREANFAMTQAGEKNGAVEARNAHTLASRETSVLSSGNVLNSTNVTLRKIDTNKEVVL